MGQGFVLHLASSVLKLRIIPSICLYCSPNHTTPKSRCVTEPHTCSFSMASILLFKAATFEKMVLFSFNDITAKLSISLTTNKFPQKPTVCVF